MKEMVLAGPGFRDLENALSGIDGIDSVEGGVVDGIEAVRIGFDPSKIALAGILAAFFYAIDDPLGGGSDAGAAVYWIDPGDSNEVLSAFGQVLPLFSGTKPGCGELPSWEAVRTPRPAGSARIPQHRIEEIRMIVPGFLFL